MSQAPPKLGEYRKTWKIVENTSINIVISRFYKDKTMNDIFIECFSGLEDKRYKNKRYKLLEIIAIVLCGVMSGMKDFSNIETFAEEHESWFKKHLKIKNGIPSHDTLERVIGLLDPAKFTECFLRWIQHIKDLMKEDVIAIDGKTITGSKISSKGKRAIHLVNAYSCANGLTLSQVKVSEKSNEIVAIPEILSCLSLKGTIITMDAMGCQKSITKQIVEAEADYILAVKGNHKSLQEPIQDIFTLAKNPKFNKNLQPLTYTHEIDCEHGKIESRAVRVFSIEKIAEHTKLEGWHNIQSIIEVENNNLSKNTSELRYYISSIDHTKTELIAKSIRKHWQVENNLHWVLDVIFKEDASTVKDEIIAQNMSWIRKIAAFLLQKQLSTKKLSTPKKMVQNCCNPNYLLDYLEV